MDRSGNQQFTFLDSKGCLWNYNCECQFVFFICFQCIFLCVFYFFASPLTNNSFLPPDFHMCVWSSSDTFTSLTMLHLNICIKFKAKGHEGCCDITISLESNMHVLVPLETKQKGS